MQEDYLHHGAILCYKHYRSKLAANALVLIYGLDRPKLARVPLRSFQEGETFLLLFRPALRPPSCADRAEEISLRPDRPSAFERSCPFDLISGSDFSPRPHRGYHFQLMDKMGPDISEVVTKDSGIQLCAALCAVALHTAYSQDVGISRRPGSGRN